MSDNQPNTGGQTDTIEVMLNIYSGRPNPTWTLSERQVEELRSLLEASGKERRERGAVTPGLGYSGFVITNHAPRSGIPHRVKVYGGTLAMTAEAGGKGGDKKSQQPSFHADTHRLESWLLEQARERGHAEAIEKMGGPRLTEK